MQTGWIKPMFIIAALYDFILGIVFLIAFKPIYRMLGLTLPNHDGYVQFGAALVAIFGVGFWLVARAPQRNRDIIIMGILLKLSYAGVVLGHYFFGSVPGIWIPFAWIDLIFAGIFIAALRALTTVPAKPA